MFTVGLCMHVCMCVCVCVCVFVTVTVCVCMHACVCLFGVFVCVYIHFYADIYLTCTVALNIDIG